MRISKKKFIYRISISNLCWIWTGKSHLYEDSNRFDINTQMFVAMATKNYSTHSCVNTEDSSGYILLFFKHVITHSKKIVFCTKSCSCNVSKAKRPPEFLLPLQPENIQHGHYMLKKALGILELPIHVITNVKTLFCLYKYCSCKLL